MLISNDKKILYIKMYIKNQDQLFYNFLCETKIAISFLPTEMVVYEKKPQQNDFLI